jgi:crotonobetainyl-CoA:carnitine CoA-transferase CaiB-like acyl-CoA transferase
MTMLSTPADFAERPARPRFRAPRLGEHTAEVLADLGYPPERSETLIGAGAVFTEATARGPD